MSVNDKHSERHSTGTTTENVAKLNHPSPVLEYWRQMIHNVCNIVRLLYRMCQWILSDELNKRHTAAKYVTRLMSSDQKELCIAVCTGDESGVFGYNPEMKQQPSQWKTQTSPWTKKGQVWSNVQSMLICFLTLKELSIRKFIHQDRHWLENSIAMFWGNWGKISGANIQTSGATIPGHHIITMLQLTCCLLCSCFWLLRQQQSSPTLPNHWSSPPVNFYYSQRWNWR